MTKLKRIGKLSEYYVAYKLSENGFNVVVPTGAPRYDLIAEKGDDRYFIQVKSVARQDDLLKVYLQTSKALVGYRPNEVDIIAIHERKENKIYFVPISDIEGLTAITLRFTERFGTQGRKTHYAKDYEAFPYHITKTDVN